MADVGRQIERLLRIRGLSLTELAEKANISKGHLWQLLHGQQPNPTLEVLEKIAKALDTTVGEVLGRKIVGKEAPKLPEQVPEDLQRFLDVQRERGNVIPDSDLTLLAQIRFRAEKPISVTDWELIYRTLDVLASRSVKRQKK